MTSWGRLWLLSLTFGMFLLFATLLETQGAFGSGRFAAILMNVSGIGLPFFVVAVELTLLGHADIATTEVYTHLAIQRLKTVHRMHHPRAKRVGAA